MSKNVPFFIKKHVLSTINSFIDLDLQLEIQLETPVICYNPSNILL